MYKRVVKGETEEDGERLEFSEKDIGRTIMEMKREQKARETENDCTVTKEEVDKDVFSLLKTLYGPNQDRALGKPGTKI